MLKLSCVSQIQDATGVNVQNNQNQEIPGSSCDLSSLDPLCNDSEEILRQLVENPFDVDSFFTEFNGADVKVSFTLSTCFLKCLKAPEYILQFLDCNNVESDHDDYVVR